MTENLLIGTSTVSDVTSSMVIMTDANMKMQGECSNGLSPMEMSVFLASSYQWRGLRLSP